MTAYNDDVVVTLTDMREVGFCANGGRLLAARYPHLDWYEFRHHGLRASVLRTIDDARVEQAIAHARARVNAHG